MGAGCSSTVIQKYKELKQYLQTGPCLTFHIVETFLPIGEYSPVILIGEDHSINESEVVDFLFEKYDNFDDDMLLECSESISSRCVTVFTAMKKMISNCENPKTHINFVIESPIVEDLSEINEKFQKVKDFTPRYSLIDARDKAHRFSKHYQNGLSVVNFDILFYSRLIFNTENKMIDTMFFNENQLVQLAQNELDSFIKLNDTNCFFVNDLHEIMSFTGYYSTLMSEGYRELFEPIFRNNTIKTNRIRNTLQNDGMSEQEARRLIPSLHFWMFSFICWCRVFTTKMISHFQEKYIKSNKFVLKQKDVEQCSNLLEESFQKIEDDPTLMVNMFLFITLCGDILTYIVYLKKEISKKDNIFVIFGGAKHTNTFSKILNDSNTHKLDYVRKVDKKFLNSKKIIK